MGVLRICSRQSHPKVLIFSRVARLFWLYSVTMNLKSGFLLVDKPAGWTSFDVCAKLRRPLGTKRVGHTGTLDPFATGLLVVAFGKATKLIPFFEKDIKTYEATILVGHTSETLDPESEIIKIQQKNPTKGGLELVEKVVKDNFLGKISQIPPKYSALKVNGQKLYDLARAGKEVEIKSRETEVLACEVLEAKGDRIKVRLRVAAGFYVRSFARDLGAALGLGGGICEVLRRTGVGELEILEGSFEILNEIHLKTGEGIERGVMDATKLLDLRVVEIKADRWDDFSGGRVVTLAQSVPEGIKVLVQIENQTVGLGEIVAGHLQPRVVFEL